MATLYEIYNFGRPLLGHHYKNLSLYGPCPEGQKIFLRNASFYTFNPQITPLGVVDHEIYIFLIPFPKDTTYQIWSR